MIVRNKPLLAEFRTPGRCEFCGKQCKLREPAHIFSVGAGRLDIRCNLVALGSTSAMACACHSKSHAGQRPTTADLLEIVAKREKCLVSDIVAVKDLLRRMPKRSTPSAIRFAAQGWTGVTADLLEETILKIPKENYE